MTPDFRAQLQLGLGDSYVLERELTGGGMSRVFVAEETSLGRKIVVKVLPPETAAEVSFERFKREISFAARLQHPHIVPLLAAGEAAGLPYFTMPFIEGESLRVRIAREGELPVADGVRILREVAAALDYAHDQGIVHRDIKPDNVLLSRGSAMVTDFGVAKALSASTNAERSGVTSIGLALGTPAYMAPEQAAASPTIDNRADIYAFGVLAFELFAGRTPFAGRSPHAMLAAHVTEAPELIGNLRPTLPRPLAALIMRCMEKHAADRPQAAEIVHQLDAITTPSGGSDPAVTVGVRAQTLPGRRFTAVRIAAGTVAVGLVAATSWQLLGPTKDNPAGSTTSRAIAVLPFENIGGDTANAYFGVGMADAVTSALSKVPGLTLRAIRTAPASRDPQEIGRVQQVFAVVDGKVQRAGDRLRLTASLTRVSDGAVLWSETYTRSATDVFAVQDEVSRAIAGALEAKLGAALVTAPTKDLEAYDLYLKGRYLWNQRTKPSLEAAIARFKAAIGRDSSFALAYVGLADALAVTPQYAETRGSDSFRSAEAAAVRALKLEPDNAEAHASLGLLHSYQYNWKRAEDEFERAIALRPQYPTSYHWYSLSFLYQGRVEEAAAQIALGKQLDPTSRIIATAYALIVQASGDVDRAIVEYGKAIELGTFAEAHRRLARVHALRGDYVAAEAEVKRASATSGLPENADLGYVLAKSGRRAEAQRLVEALVDRSTREYVSPGTIGFVYLGLGDHDRALHWFTRSVEDQDQRTREVITDRRFDPLRGDPRFRALLVKMNLPPG